MMRHLAGETEGQISNGQKGLTLIELLIVVAILGITAAVVVPNMGAFLSFGWVNAANTEAESVKTASLAYYAEYGAYPGNSTALAGFVEGDLTGSYTMCTEHGWLVNASGNWIDVYGLTWTGGQAGDGGRHGNWGH